MTSSGHKISNWTKEESMNKLLLFSDKQHVVAVVDCSLFLHILTSYLKLQDNQPTAAITQLIRVCFLFFRSCNDIWRRRKIKKNENSVYEQLPFLTAFYEYNKRRACFG